MTDEFKIEKITMLVRFSDGYMIEVEPPKTSYVSDPFDNRNKLMAPPAIKYSFIDKYPESEEVLTAVEKAVTKIAKNCWGLTITRFQD